MFDIFVPFTLYYCLTGCTITTTLDLLLFDDFTLLDMQDTIISGVLLGPYVSILYILMILPDLRNYLL